MRVTDVSSPHRVVEQTWMSALRINIRVVGALIMRDASSRFGHENIGIFWVMGEPLILTSGVIAIWSMMGSTHGHGVGLVPFLLTGYSMLTLWRHIVQRATHAMRQSAGLLFHRNVRVLDVLVARAIIEVVGVLTAFFIAYVPLALTGWLEPINDPLLLIGAWGLLSLFSFGIGMMIAALTEVSEAAERFIPAIMYLTIPLTGALFMLSWLPEAAQRVLLWSPLIDLMEMFRAGMFSPDVQTRWSGSYIAVSCLVVNVIGLALVLTAQNHIRSEA